MIYKHPDYKNGYVFAKSSTDSDLQNILKSYNKLSCIICNRKTLINFTPPANCYGFPKPKTLNDKMFPSSNIFVINEKIADGCFFINGTF